MSSSSSALFDFGSVGFRSYIFVVPVLLGGHALISLSHFIVSQGAECLKLLGCLVGD